MVLHRPREGARVGPRDRLGVGRPHGDQIRAVDGRRARQRRVVGRHRATDVVLLGRHVHGRQRRQRRGRRRAGRHDRDDRERHAVALVEIGSGHRNRDRCVVRRRLVGDRVERRRHVDVDHGPGEMARDRKVVAGVGDDDVDGVLGAGGRGKRQRAGDQPGVRIERQIRRQAGTAVPQRIPGRADRVELKGNRVAFVARLIGERVRAIEGRRARHRAVARRARAVADRNRAAQRVVRVQRAVGLRGAGGVFLHQADAVDEVRARGRERPNRLGGRREVELVERACGRIGRVVGQRARPERAAVGRDVEREEVGHAGPAEGAKNVAVDVDLVDVGVGRDEEAAGDRVAGRQQPERVRRLEHARLPGLAVVVLEHDVVGHAGRERRAVERERVDMVRLRRVEHRVLIGGEIEPVGAAIVGRREERLDRIAGIHAHAARVERVFENRVGAVHRADEHVAVLVEDHRLDARREAGLERHIGHAGRDGRGGRVDDRQDAVIDGAELRDLAGVPAGRPQIAVRIDRASRGLLKPAVGQRLAGGMAVRVVDHVRPGVGDLRHAIAGVVADVLDIADADEHVAGLPRGWLSVHGQTGGADCSERRQREPDEAGGRARARGARTLPNLIDECDQEAAQFHFGVLRRQSLY